MARYSIKSVLALSYTVVGILMTPCKRLLNKDDFVKRCECGRYKWHTCCLYVNDNGGKSSSTIMTSWCYNLNNSLSYMQLLMTSRNYNDVYPYCQVRGYFTIDIKFIDICIECHGYKSKCETVCKYAYQELHLIMTLNAAYGSIAAKAPHVLYSLM